MSEGSYQVFKYDKPSDMPGGKAIVQLAGSDIIRGRFKWYARVVRITSTRIVIWTVSGWCLPVG